MQARYYDPIIGRFYSNDPVGYRDVHSFNRYTYAANNPYRYTDPTGEKEELAFAAGVGAGMSKESATVIANAERSIGNDRVAGTIESVSDIKADVQSGNSVLGAIVGAAVAKATNPLDGTTYTEKVETQMSNSSDTDHGFPSAIDKEAGNGTQTTITGGDGTKRTKVSLPGKVNGRKGNYTWIIEPNKTVNHRQFEAKRKK